ncbi:ATP-binding protein [Telmatospirillum sp. J64-1]|uniref:ATP-binding protein n=1 Tax=Telmatospirillum sp. J64-1 TaxID=2502183 RepID=UPI00115D0BD8|nr:ATP-binding protein [Telmatospirillum sp. J64-1]
MQSSEQPHSLSWSALGAERGTLWLAAAFVLVYLPFDWITFIHERPALNITPWNPPAGLYLALLLWVGARGTPLVYGTLVLADLLIRGYPGSWWSLLLSNLVIVCGYTAAALFLRRIVRIDPQLGRLKDVAWLVGTVFIGSAVVALFYVGTLVAEGAFPLAELPVLAFQYWLGDVTGIAVVAPLLLVHGRPGHDILRHWRRFLASVPVTPFQALSLLAALTAVFLPFAQGQFNLFYLLFLPLIWIAVTKGLRGAVFAAFAIQAGLIAGLQVTGQPVASIIYHQTLMLALALTALFLGCVVSERRRVEIGLREHQNQLAHIARLTVTGEMASALAHELNQPLLAAISYTRAAQRVLGGTEAPPKALELMNKAVGQAERAGEVIRGLRTFLGKGPPQVEPVAVAEIVREALTLARADTSYNSVRLQVDLPEGLPPVLADRIQIEQVLLNLVHNSIDAMAVTEVGKREIAVRVFSGTDGQVIFAVTDSGPGVPPEMVDRLYSPFATTKPAGMGLGLPICRSIIEAHGGRLWLEASSDNGACFHFSLPAA